MARVAIIVEGSRIAVPVRSLREQVRGVMSNRKKRSDVTRTRTSAARSPNERLEPARAPSRPRGLQEHEPSRLVSGLVRVASSLLTFALVVMMLIGGSGAVVYSLVGGEVTELLAAARRLLRQLVSEGQELGDALETDVTGIPDVMTAVS